MGLLSRKQILEMGFCRVGDNCRLSDKASYYNCSNIVIGNNVRVDDYCVLSAGEGGIKIGNNIHVAVYASLIGAGKIQLHDYCNLSSRVSIYSSNDDYSGHFMTNPTIPNEFTNVHSADVILHKHVIIGSGSILLPGIELGEGVAVGALSLVTRSCQEFGIYSGVPVKRIKERSRALLDHESKFVCS